MDKGNGETQNGSLFCSSVCQHLKVEPFLSPGGKTRIMCFLGRSRMWFMSKLSRKALKKKHKVLNMYFFNDCSSSKSHPCLNKVHIWKLLYWFLLIHKYYNYFERENMKGLIYTSLLKLTNQSSANNLLLHSIYFFLSKLKSKRNPDYIDYSWFVKNH